MKAKHLIIAASFVFVGVVAAGMAGESRGESLSPSVLASHIIVTRTQSGLPRGCRPREAAQFVQGMFAAFGKGDEDRFFRFFFHSGLRGERFRWFTISDGVSDINAVTRSQLGSYLSARVKQRDTIRLRHIDILVDRALGVGHFGFFAVRRAQDLPSERGGSAGIFEGKGAYNCRARTFVVFSASMEPAPGRMYPHPLTGEGGPCLLPTGWHPVQGPIVACTRRSR